MRTLTASHRKILAPLGMGLALIFLVACAGQSPTASGSQANANVAPVSNSAAYSSLTPAERDALASASGYMTYEGRMTGISVTGMGQATGVPDMATINVGVEASRDTVQAARDDAAAAMGQVIEVLRQQGIEDRDIQTRYFSINTQYDREGQNVIGFQVSNQVTVKVRDLDNVGAVVDQVVAAGGDLTRFQGISFSIADTKPLERDAREAAVADLRAKAEQLAQLAGVPLGPLVSITETGGAMPLAVRERSFMAMDAAASTPIMAGEMDVTITLQAVYAIGTAQPAQ